MRRERTTWPPVLALTLAAAGTLGCGLVGFDGSRLGPGSADASPDAVGPGCVARAAVGYGHTCVVRTDGELWCVGRNVDGELGNGEQAARADPTTILPGPLALIFLGTNHGCALPVGADLRCWGRGRDGQLGDGAMVDRLTPTLVTGLDTPTAGDAGDDFTCAIVSGAAWCWGAGTEGQLGDGTSTTRARPAPVGDAGQPAFSAITAGDSHACALGVDASVWCWGDNSDGQLGDGSLTRRTTPVQVPGQRARQVVAGGEFTCAVRTDDSVWCWGANSDGKLGNDPVLVPRSSTPLAVAGLGPGTTSSIGAGAVHTCAVRLDGSVRCWGRHNGRLGDGQAGVTSAWTPVIATGVASAAAVTAGTDSTCVRRANGTVACWGQNDAGEVGSGDFFQVNTATATAIDDATDLAMAGYRTCAVRGLGDGSLACWGSNADGELGDGSVTDHEEAVPIAAGVVDVDASAGFTCAAYADGAVRCWGAGGAGNLGDGARRPRLTPTLAQTLPGAVEVTTGGTFACTRDGAGELSCWGGNYAGELGDGTLAQRSVGGPLVSLPGPMAEIAGGDQHACARSNAGEVLCWGSGGGGRIGDGTGNQRLAPTLIAGLSPARRVAVGEDVSCAITSTDALYCWGENDTLDVIGDDDEVDRTAPTAIMVGGPVDDVAVGHDTTCALVAGVVSCWGSAEYGKLGDGSTMNRSTPGPVPGLPSIKALVAGSQADHLCALSTDDNLWCWGQADHGQLGPTRADRTTPAPIAVPCP